MPNDRSRRCHRDSRRRLTLEALESRRLLAVGWRNPVDAFDVNADQKVNAFDALQIINHLRGNGGEFDISVPRSIDSPYLDVDGNGVVSAFDALSVMNVLGSGTHGVRSHSDSDQLISEQSTLIEVGGAGNKRTYQLEIEGSLGGASLSPERSRLNQDVVSVFLLDPNDPSRSLLDPDGNRPRPIFSLTSTGEHTVAGISEWDGKILELDLTGISGSDTGRLVFQTLNRNGRRDTSLNFRLLENRADAISESFVQVSHERDIALPGSSLDLTEFVSAEDALINERLAFYDSANRVFVSELSVEAGDRRLGRAAIVAFPDLPLGVRIMNTSGVDDNGVPYINISTAIPLDGLAPHTSSQFFRVEYQAPSNDTFALSPSVQVSTNDQAPVVSGTLENKFDRAIYTFRQGQSGPVFFDSFGSDGFTISVQGSDGRIVELVAGSEHDERVPFLGAGDYTLTLESTSAVSLDFDLALRYLKDAPEISLGETITGTLSKQASIFRLVGNPGTHFDLVRPEDVPQASVRVIDGADTEMDERTVDKIQGVSIPRSGELFLLVEPSDVGLESPEEVRFSLSTVISSVEPPGLFDGRPLALDSLVNGALESFDEEARYSFRIDKETVVYFDAGVNQAGVQWSLEGPYGYEASQQRFTTAPSQSRFNYFRLLAGDYELSVIGDRSRQTPIVSPPSFSFSLRNFSVQDPIVVGAKVRGTFNFNDSVAYRFSGTSGERFSFDAREFENMENASWRLFTPSGITRFNTPFQDIQSLTLSESGIHTLLVTRERGEIDNAAFSFVVQPLPIRPTTPVQIGVTTSGLLLHSNDTKIYTFSLTETKTLFRSGSLDMRNFDATLRGPIKGNAENAPVISKNSLAFDSIVELHPGDYELVMSWDGDGSSEFEFTLVDLSTAEPIDAEESISTTIPLGRAVFYQMDLSAENQYEIALPESTLTNDLEFLLINPSGLRTTVRSASLFSIGTSGDHVLIVKRKASSIQIDPNFAFQINPFIPNPPKELKLGEITRGTTGRPLAPQQRYHFTLDQWTSLHLDDFNSRTTASGFRLQLEGPDGERIDCLDQVCGKFDFPLDRLQYFPPGDYVAIVDTQYRANQDYAFQLTDLRMAPRVAVNKVVSGELELGSSKPYQVQLNKGDRIYLDAQGMNPSHTLNWWLIDPLGRRRFKGSVASFPQMTAASSGNYLLILESTNQNSNLVNEPIIGFDFTVQALPPPTPITLALGSLASGTLTAKNNKVAYEFSLETATQLSFTSPEYHSQRSPLRWSMTGPGFNLESQELSQRKKTGSSQWLSVPAGTFELTIQSSSFESVDFGFSLTDLSMLASLPIDTPVSIEVKAGTTVTRQFSAMKGNRYYFEFDDPAASNDRVIWSLFDPWGLPVQFNYSLGLAVDEVPFDGEYTLITTRPPNTRGGDLHSFTIRSVGPSRVKPIELGEAVVGGFHDSSFLNEFTFTLTEPAPLLLDFMPELGATGSATWKLESTSGFTVTDSVHASTSYLRLDTIFPAGDYTLTISDISIAAMAFPFRLVNLNDAPVAGLELDQDLSLGKNQTIAYAIALTEGDTLRLTMASPGEASWVLIDPKASVIASSNSWSGQELQARISGNYTLIVDSRNASSEPQNLQFTASVTASDPSPELTGTPLLLGAPTSGGISSNFIGEIYHFTLTTKSSLYFTEITSTRYISLTLTGPGGLMVRSSTGSSIFANDQITSLQNLDAGNYQLVVAGNRFDVYSFTLADRADAPLIQAGRETNGELSVPDTDVYQFEGTKGDQFYVRDLVSEQPDSITLRLIDPFGRQVVSGGQVLRTIDDYQLVELSSTGLYTMFLERNVPDKSKVAYAFEIELLQPIVEGSVEINERIAGTIKVPGERSVYSLEIEKPKLVYLGVNVAKVARSSRNAIEYTIGQDGTDFSYYDKDARYDVVASPAKVLLPGTYTVTFKSRYQETGSYQFQWVDLSVATQIKTDLEISAAVAPGQVQTFRFSGSNGQQIWMDQIDPSNPRTAKWTLLNSAGQLLASARLDQDGPIVSLPADGEYLLVVDSYLPFNDVPTESDIAPYAFSLRTVTVRDTERLTLGEFVNGRLSTPEDVAEFAFDLDQYTHLVFDAVIDSESKSELYWELPQLKLGNSQFSGRFESLRESTLRSVFLPPGQYELKLAAFDYGVGEFQFRVVSNQTATIVNRDVLVKNVHEPGQSNFFRFAAVRGDRVFVDFEPTGLDDWDQPYWRLTDPLGKTLQSGRISESEIELLKFDGDYLFWIEGRTAIQASEDFDFTFKTIDLQPPQPITLGELVTDTIEAPGDSQRYIFSLSNPARVYVDAISTLRSDPKVKWTLFNSSQRFLGTGNSRSSANKTSQLNDLTSIDLPAGEYSLEVGGEAGDIAFRILSKDSATPISLDTEIRGSVPSRQIELLQFQGHVGQQLTFEPTSASTPPLSWYLIDPNGTEIFGRSYAATELFTLSDVGTYTLILGGAANTTQPNDYSFIIRQPVEFGPTPIVSDGKVKTLSPTINFVSERSLDDFHSGLGNL